MQPQNAVEWTVPISERLSVRLYGNTGPRRHLTASLQKGLILVSNGTELVGEGIGFGVPAVRHRNRTYFPGLSTVEFKQTQNHTTATKRFALNLTSERTLRNVRIETERIRRIRRSFDELYMKHRHFRLLMTENLLRQIGIRRNFVQTEPVGSTSVTYSIIPPCINVKADFKLLRRGGFQKIYLLNEQSSKHFRKYYDSGGTILFDKDIGAWESVSADWACIHSAENKVGFQLWKPEEFALYRGREYLNGIFDWIGLDFEADPEKTCIEYEIELVRS